MKIENNVIIGGPLNGLRDGDMVWSAQAGQGEISFLTTAVEYPLYCNGKYYTISGRYALNDKHQPLYFSQPAVPVRTKRLVEKTLDVFVFSDIQKILDDDFCASVFLKEVGISGAIPAKLIFEVEE